MKKFLILCDTAWCGTEATYRAEANSELELSDIAEQLAYDNFQQYGYDSYILEDEGYNPDEMSQEELDEVWSHIDETEYYWSNIEEFYGTDEEWEDYGGKIYKVNSVV